MNILMLTNVYLPQVGGIQRSVAAFTETLRQRGHRVLVVTPDDPKASDDEADVVRLPALPDVTGSGFSFSLPIPGYLLSTLDELAPDIVHVHQPLLLGATAVRIATVRNIPLVFTYHTRYEYYSHEALDESETLRTFMIELADDFANLCDGVVAPSESIKSILEGRGVTSSIEAIPTGVRPEKYRAGDGARLRQKLDIPADACVIGHVGRLVPEKNLAFVGRAAAQVLKERPQTRLLLVGEGVERDDVITACREAGVADQLVAPGKLEGADLVDAYHAMDVFAFASHSETQGMVLSEALSAGVPIVGVDAPGTREAISDGECGRLVSEHDETQFAQVLGEFVDLPAEQRRRFVEGARRQAEEYALEHCADRMLSFYETLTGRNPRRREVVQHPWMQSLRRVQAEWRVISSRAGAAARAIGFVP